MLLDQLQTEYRDRFIRLAYVWALKYSPTQARDAKGQWTESGAITKLRQLPRATDPRDTRFILPDGTRLKGNDFSPEHSYLARSVETTIQEVMEAGVVRYIYPDNANVQAPITAEQAQVIYDNWVTFNEQHKTSSPLNLDFWGMEGTQEDYREGPLFKMFLPGTVNADGIRRFIAQHYAATKFDSTQPRDKNGRWVLDKTGQPLVVYHGSVSPNVTGSKLNPNQPPVRPRSGPNGIYFTSNAQSAYNYIRMPGAGIKGPKGHVIPANIRMSNPLDITDAVKKGRKTGLSFGEAKRKALEALTKDHDGVIFRGDDYNPDEYIVFSADQIGPVQSIAKKFTEVLKYDPNQPRGKGGRWVDAGGGKAYWVDRDQQTDEPTIGRSFTSEEGYQWHEQGPVAEWAKGLSHEDERAISNYSGFGYHDINDLRRGTYKTPITDHFVRAATPEEMRRVGWDVEKGEWVPSIKVKEGEYKAGYPVDPRDQITPETIARFGYPAGKNTPRDYDPDDPYHRVDDGRIVINQYYRPVSGGPQMMFSIQRAGPDLERLATVQKEASAIDDLIANRGYELPESIVVQRGAYLPGVTFEQLQDMVYEGPEGEPPAIWEEKGFTSTFVGDAEGRAKSYPALGKWESIQHRFGNRPNSLVEHQDEVGTAVRFYITLPAGTKVAPIEASRRMHRNYPRVPDPSPLPDGADPKYWTISDFTATPEVDSSKLQDKHSRSESELLLGSGARFRVRKVTRGYTYHTNDPMLKSVEVVEVHLEYIGGGSSDGTHYQKAS